MSKLTLVLLLACCFSSGAWSQCTLFFSEYLEGTSNNKACEIYNPTGASVNLIDYKVYRYNNGSPTPSDSLQLQGTLAAGAVYVMGNPSAVANILSVSDTLHTITFFNGDDVLELRYMPTNTMLDVIGQIGVDPGTNWPVGTGATSEFTLVRMYPHLNGETNWAIGATEWDVYPQNTFTYLGSHSGAACCTPTSSSFSASACGSYTWAQNGSLYTISGAYNDTIPNAAGCDSVVTLNLTILNPSSGTDLISACDSHMWIDGVTYTSSNNTATYTLTNAAGCDSVITLDLTITYSNAGTDVITACDDYIWIDGITYAASNNTATYTLTNAAGCDSVVTLNLTIVATPVAMITDNGDGTLTASGGVTYQWLNCSGNQPIAGETNQTIVLTVDGVYAAIVSNGSGCTDTTDCVNVDYLQLENKELFAAMISPNPATDLVIISFAGSIADLTVYDAQGRILQVEKSISNGDSIDLTSFENGLHYFLLKVGEQKVIYPVVKR